MSEFYEMASENPKYVSQYHELASEIPMKELQVSRKTVDFP
ncbi:hypothetical protein [Virgibacillus dokdonensis]|nr:hypothetical protein [Virgibacillus dokdonensis]